ncbi:MAG: membrane protein insertion efficiency factor YidD [Gammaproteobacteria bacterium]|nr:membrane protein insertion efficiency factor YidD [Gammaproteobacteria bacterium]
MRKILILIIRAYQYLLSPLLGPSCRFYPSCSCYAQEALQQHGVIKGGWLALRRLLRCHPWHPGGIDLVPGQDAPGGTHSQQHHHKCAVKNNG